MSALEWHLHQKGCIPFSPDLFLFLHPNIDGLKGTADKDGSETDKAVTVK